jgi:hypothetical protein
MDDVQLQTLRTAIDADPALTAYWAAGNAEAIAQHFRAETTFVVWRTSVTNEEIGDAMNGSEVAGLASLPMQRLQVLAALSNGTQNPSRFDRRDAFDRIFSGAGGQLTRAALAIIWRRLANRGEQLFATGTGSDASPATMTFEGGVTFSDVAAAMRN